MKKFNDSSLVSACLNYDRENQNIHSSYESENRLDKEKNNLYWVKNEFYTSQYKLDFTDPQNTKMSQGFDSKSGCRCQKCQGNEVPMFNRNRNEIGLHKATSSLFPLYEAPRVNNRIPFNYSNSFMNCFRDVNANKRQSKQTKRQTSVMSNRTFDKTEVSPEPEPKIVVEKYLNKRERSSISLQLNNQLPCFVKSNESLSNVFNQTAYNNPPKELSKKKTAMKKNVKPKPSPNMSLYGRSYLVEKSAADFIPNPCNHLCLMCEKCVRKLRKSSYRRVYCIDLFEEDRCK